MHRSNRRIAQLSQSIRMGWFLDASVSNIWKCLWYLVDSFVLQLGTRNSESCIHNQFLDWTQWQGHWTDLWMERWNQFQLEPVETYSGTSRKCWVWLRCGLFGCNRWMGMERGGLHFNTRSPVSDETNHNPFWYNKLESGTYFQQHIGNICLSLSGGMGWNWRTMLQSLPWISECGSWNSQSLLSIPWTVFANFPNPIGIWCICFMEVRFYCSVQTAITS